MAFPAKQSEPAILLVGLQYLIAALALKEESLSSNAQHTPIQMTKITFPMDIVSLFKCPRQILETKCRTIVKYYKAVAFYCTIREFDFLKRHTKLQSANITAKDGNKSG